MRSRDVRTRNTGQGPVVTRRSDFSKAIDERVAARIRKRRLLLGMTQETLAIALKVSEQEIRRFESGAFGVAFSRLSELGEIFNVPLSYFLDDLEADLPGVILSPPGGWGRLGESKKPGYIEDDPPAKAADTSASLGMRDDLNIAVKQARAEIADNAKAELAKVRAALKVERLKATYEVLIRKSDLNNSTMPEQERLRRAEHLLTTYKRLRKINPDFHDDSEQLKTARSITNKANYQRRIAKAGQKAELAM
jgi:DNA-binding XRE family transcriptional regulator